MFLKGILYTERRVVASHHLTIEVMGYSFAPEFFQLTWKRWSPILKNLLRKEY